jgi:hypothetical protein
VKPLCAICADREADTITDWECASGRVRTIVACWPCLSPVPDPPEEYEPADIAERIRERAIAPVVAGRHAMRDAVLQAVKRLGRATTAEIRVELNMHTLAEQDHVTAALSRLVRHGALTAVDLVPGEPTIGREYRATGARPQKPHRQPSDRRSRKLCAAESILASIDGEFTCAAAGISARMLTVLRRRGLVELVRAKRGPPYQPAIWRRIDRKEQSHAA